jgi:hypothetical protein
MSDWRTGVRDLIERVRSKIKRPALRPAGQPTTRGGRGDALEALGFEQGGEFDGVGFAFHGVEETEDLETLVGAAAGDFDHPVFGLGGGDDHLVGPGDDLGSVDDAGSDAFDVIFSLGAEPRWRFVGLSGDHWI